MDDDGLTDGQELIGITTQSLPIDVPDAGIEDMSFSTDSGFGSPVIDERTDPRNPDSDGDGYWDGWVGVYDVGYTDNVVLYREHLRDDDGTGISLSPYDYEGVPEMAGVHEAGEAPSATSAELYDNGTQYHSNIHLGELTLGRDANTPASEVTYSLGVLFTDSLGGAFDDKADIREIVDMAKRNYALYGINVEYVSPENWSVDPRLVDSIDDVDRPIGPDVGQELKSLVGSDTVDKRFDRQPDVLVYFDTDTQGSRPCFGRTGTDLVDRDEQSVPVLTCTANQGLW